MQPYQLAIIEPNPQTPDIVRAMLDELGTHFRIPSVNPFILSESHGKLVVIANSVRNNWVGYFILEEVCVHPV